MAVVDRDSHDDLILRHFTLIGITVVSAVAIVLVVGTSVTCWFDLVNRRHKLPSDGKTKTVVIKGDRKKKRRKGSCDSTSQNSKESDDPIEAPPPRTNKSASHQYTLSEKRRKMEVAAKTFSQSLDFMVEDTQSDPIMDAVLKTADHVEDVWGDLKEHKQKAGVDHTQKSVKSSNDYADKTQLSDFEKKSLKVAVALLDSKKQEKKKEVEEEGDDDTTSTKTRNCSTCSHISHRGHKSSSKHSKHSKPHTTKEKHHAKPKDKSAKKESAPNNSTVISKQ